MDGQLGLECLGLATLKALLIVEDYLRGSAGDLVSPTVFYEKLSTGLSTGQTRQGKTADRSATGTRGC